MIEISHCTKQWQITKIFRNQTIKAQEGKNWT